MEIFQVGALPSIYYIPDFVTTEQEQKLIDQIHAAPRTKWRELKGRRLQYWGGMVHEKGMIPEPVPKWLEGVLTNIAAKTDLFPSPLNHVLINEYLPGQGIMAHQDGPLYYPVVAILSLGSPAVMRFTPHKSSSPHPPADSQATADPETVCSSRDTATFGSSSREQEGNCAPAGKARDSSAASSQEAWQGSGQASSMQNGSADIGTRLPSNHKDQHGAETPCKPSDCSVVLMPRSLLVFKDEAYTDYLHGIDESTEHDIDETVVNPSVVETMSSSEVQGRGYPPEWESSLESETSRNMLPRVGSRLSLTCRRVLKVRKALIRLR